MERILAALLALAIAGCSYEQRQRVGSALVGFGQGTQEYAPAPYRPPPPAPFQTQIFTPTGVHYCQSLGPNRYSCY